MSLGQSNNRSLDITMKNFILSPPLLLILAIVLYVISEIIRQNADLPKQLIRFQKYFRNIAVMVFFITCVVWFSSLNEKVHMSQVAYHKMQVISVTSHVEKMLNKGDYDNAKLILNRFNSSYLDIPRNDNDMLNKLRMDIGIPLYSTKNVELNSLKLKSDEIIDSEQAGRSDRD